MSDNFRAERLSLREEDKEIPPNDVQIAQALKRWGRFVGSEILLKGTGGRASSEQIARALRAGGVELRTDLELLVVPRISARQEQAVGLDENLFIDKMSPDSTGKTRYRVFL